MKKLISNIEYDGRMDPEVIELCNSINALPSLRTTSSCCGHGSAPFMIWIECDGKTLDGLFFLTRCVDRRYFEHGWDWQIELEVGDIARGDILPIHFVLCSGYYHGKKKVVGQKAYDQATNLVENMNHHLNHENFMKGFNLNIDNFERTNITAKP